MQALRGSRAEAVEGEGLVQNEKYANQALRKKITHPELPNPDAVYLQGYGSTVFLQGG